MQKKKHGLQINHNNSIISILTFHEYMYPLLARMWWELKEGKKFWQSIECISMLPYEPTSLDTQYTFCSHAEKSTLEPQVINQQEVFRVLSFIFTRIRNKMMDLG
jgi:hypothetical protein